MKRLTLLLFLTAFCISAFAQMKPEAVLKLLQTNRVSLEYDCTVGKEAPVRYTGKAILQKGAFLLKGNGLEIYCNGKEIVCVDPKAKEIIIEKAGTIEEYVQQNIGNVKDIKFYRVTTEAISENLDIFNYPWTTKDKSWIITDLRQ